MAKVLWALILAAGQLAVAQGASPAAQTAPGYDPAIEKYVRFLETQKQTPVDYIMGSPPSSTRSNNRPAAGRRPSSS